MLGLWCSFIMVLLLNYVSAFIAILGADEDSNSDVPIGGILFVITYIAILVLGGILFGLNIRNLV